jgi:hypothetical protein
VLGYNVFILELATHDLLVCNRTNETDAEQRYRTRGVEQLIMTEHLTELMDSILTYSTAVTALVAGALAILALVPKKKKHAVVYAWTGAIIALVSAGLGTGAIMTSQSIDAQHNAIEKTWPELKSDIQTKGYDPVIVEIALFSENRIPYSYTHTVTTKGGIVIGGIMMRGIIHDPRTDTEPLKITLGIPRQKIIDGYLEILFQYSSLYADQFFKGRASQLKWKTTTNTQQILSNTQ